MPFWHRIVIAAAVFAAVSLLARLVDWRLSRRPLPPEAVTRYRVLRRSVMTSILVVGFFSALLVIPQVRAIAGGLLASSAVVGVIVGFASQRTLGNFVAGLLIAITQPVRLGDRVTVDGNEGVVEEIGLTYTFIRTADEARIVIPNEKLASDTIRNATIRSREKVAEISLQIPLATELRPVVASLEQLLERERDAAVFVSDLTGNATITIRARAEDEDAAQRLERELRLRVQDRLRADGVFA
jgi:small-conductance mechanosensitive channel